LDAPASSRAIASTLRRLEPRLDAFDHGISLAQWRLYSGEKSSDLDRWQTARSRFLGDRMLRNWLERAHRSASPGDSLGRRLELLSRLCLEAAAEQHSSVVQLRGRLERRLVSFRPRFQGRRVDRAKVQDELRDNPDARVREDAYRAEDELWDRVAADVQRLVRARNARARTLGFRSYPELRLGFEGMAVTELRELCDAAIGPFAAKFRQFREEFLATSLQNEWFPWDLGFAQVRRASLPERIFPTGTLIPAVRSALREWGLPMGRLAIRVRQRDVPFQGVTFSIRIPSDVRILFPKKGGWERYLVAFHEFGHAVHFSSIRQPGHLLRSPGVGFDGYIEGIGDLFEEISFDAHWLLQRRGLTRRMVEMFRAGRALEHLFRFASVLNWVTTELDLYRDPSADPTPRATARLRATFGFGRYTPRSSLRTLYVTHPVYSQSYLFSLLLRKQIVQAISEQVRGDLWPNPSVGPWITDNLLAPGAQYDWIPRVRQLTGRRFGVQAFQDSVRSGEP
jgi:hypothetical protein